MSFCSTYILVTNISLNYQEATVDTTLRYFLERRGSIRAENNQSLYMLKICRNETEEFYRAYIVYNDKTIHGDIVTYLNNMYIMGAYIQVRNIFFRYKITIDSNTNMDVIYNAQNQRITGKHVFSDDLGEYYDVLIDEQITSRLTDFTHGENISNNNYFSNNIRHDALSQNEILLSVNNNIQSTLSTLNDEIEQITNQTLINLDSSLNNFDFNKSRLESSQQARCLSFNSNVNEIYTDAMRAISYASFFKCQRCNEEFGTNQFSFEEHMEQCKFNEISSFSFQIRNAKCMICLNEFRQLQTEKIRFLPCGHLLHVECFEAIFQNSIKSCPYCRISIPQQWKGNIFLN